MRHNLLKRTVAHGTHHRRLKPPDSVAAPDVRKCRWTSGGKQDSGGSNAVFEELYRKHIDDGSPEGRSLLIHFYALQRFAIQLGFETCNGS